MERRGDSEGSAQDARDRVAGLEKGLAVISAFDSERRRLTMSEVAAHCGLSRAAARRYLLTLEHLGFVTRDRNMYALTAKTLRLGQSYMYSARLPRLVDPELQRLAREARQASSAGVLDGDDVICIAATMAGPMVSATLQPGTRVPAYCTANGRVLLASLEASESDAWIERQTLLSKTDRTITDQSLLKGQVDGARQRGWCMVECELEDDLLTLSVPLRTVHGTTVAALNLSVNASQVRSTEFVSDGLPMLLRAQASLRRLL